jgi:hypothetical protein
MVAIVPTENERVRVGLAHAQLHPDLELRAAMLAKYIYRRRWYCDGAPRCARFGSLKPVPAPTHALNTALDANLITVDVDPAQCQ